MTHGSIQRLVGSALQFMGVRAADTRPADRLLCGHRVYLAGRFARRQELRLIAAELKMAGAQVTSRWLQAELPLDAQELQLAGRAAQLAQMNFEDVSRADVCISFTEQDGAPQGRGGRHTELGIALATGQKVILVGPREHVFHCLADVEHYPSWKEARRTLCPQDPTDGGHGEVRTQSADGDAVVAADCVEVGVSGVPPGELRFRRAGVVRR